MQECLHFYSLLAYICLYQMNEHLNIQKPMRVETDKQKFFHLLGDVCEDLPVDVAFPVWSAGFHHIPANRLQLIRIGKVVDLPALVIIIQACLPDFKIPTEYNIPAVPAKVLA